jgi:hypothetical protein
LIAYQILREMHDGLNEWFEAPEYALPDEAWHLSDDYAFRTKQVTSRTKTPCFQLALSDTVCTQRMQARSEFLPRYNPAETSIRSIIKEGVYVQEPWPNIYDPPDPHFDNFDAPAGEIDVLNILENGIDFEPNQARREVIDGLRDPLLRRQLTPSRMPVTYGLEPGQGWSLFTSSAPDNCDGSYDSFCNRGSDNDCLLSGHNDNRGGLRFDSLSGWMIVNIDKLEHGLIMIRMEDWIGANSNPRTEGWKCENNKHDCPEQDKNIRRQLKGDPPKPCEAFKFEFAIDGVITTWDVDEWTAQKRSLQRVVQVWTLLDDSKFGAKENVELAIRMRGCARQTTFNLSHIYWA